MIYLPDVNVWVALAAERHKHHPDALRWFEGLANGKAIFCRITQLGFLRLVTNPHVMNQDALTPMEAWQAYLRLRMDARVGFLSEPPMFPEFWNAFQPTQTRSPNLWTDAYLCAFCVGSQFTLVTFDSRIQPTNGLQLHQLSSSA